MTAEPRDVEEIRADIAWSRQTRALATTSPGVRIAIEARLIADVEPLLARLAAADRENADLRASNHAAIRLIREHGDVTAERDDLRAQLAAAERDRDEARSERDDAGLLWGRHYNDAMGALETQLAAAQAQLAEAQREAQEDSRVMLESAKATIALIKQRAELEARLEAVRSYLAMARATESTDHAAGWNLALTAVGNRIAALSAAPQPEPETLAIDVQHLERQRAWSERTFGPGRRTLGVTDHIRKELKEIVNDPDDLKEWVDVVILALDGAWRTDATPAEIIAAIKAKQARNEARTWPDWRTMSPDQAIEHVSEPEPPASDEPDDQSDSPNVGSPADEAASDREV